MSIRELSPELAQLAKDELGEVPSRIPEDLRAIKEWLSKQRHINARTDDQWLIAFLRGCKYSLERTKEKLDNYYTMKTMVPELNASLDPMDPKSQEILGLGVNVILPKPSFPNGPRVIFFRPGLCDPNRIKIEDTMRVNIMIGDLLLLEDDNNTTAGQRIVVDMKNISMGHFSQMTPSLMKKMVLTGQESMPVRQKGAHHLNAPAALDSIFNIFKSFMNAKNQSRIYFHNSNDMETLYKFVPKDVLPEEYGGNGGKIDDLARDCKLRLESRRDWFLENNAFKTDESKRPGKPKTAESLFGIEGSFRQLTVD